MQEPGELPPTHPTIVVNPERYVISCVKGIRYRYTRNNRPIFICEKCAIGVSSECESAHGFMDGLWVLTPCKWCQGPLVKTRPLYACRLCLLSYQYLMNDLGFHGITSNRITRISYDVDSHELIELSLREGSI